MERSKNTVIGGDRLLGIQDVTEMTGFCQVVASRLMDETGKSMVLHRRKFILESSLLAYLQAKEDECVC